jgi:hypothetical protein
MGAGRNFENRCSDWCGFVEVLGVAESAVFRAMKKR